MHLFSNRAVLLLSLLCGLSLSSGCFPENDIRNPRNVWIVNNSDQPIKGMYICADPRDEIWGQNLLSRKVGPGEIYLLSTGVHKDEVCWLWPHIEDQGLIAVGVLPGTCDIYVAVNRNDEGDFRVRVLGAAQSPFSVRYLLAK